MCVQVGMCAHIPYSSEVIKSDGTKQTQSVVLPIHHSSLYTYLGTEEKEKRKMKSSKGKVIGRQGNVKNRDHGLYNEYDI